MIVEEMNLNEHEQEALETLLSEQNEEEKVYRWDEVPTPPPTRPADDFKGWDEFRFDFMERYMQKQRERALRRVRRY